MIDDILATLRTSSRPLIVSDIDEVVLEFLDPFDTYLASRDHRLHPDSFRLTGNIRSTVDDLVASAALVDEFQEDFYATQHSWQKPAAHARDVLDRLSAHADIVFLTAMPPRHHEVRRAALDSHALPYPMISTEEKKGPIVKSLIGDRDVPAVFIDDILYNLQSVRDHAPDCLLINLMANGTFRALAPDPGQGVLKALDWIEAERLILDHFNVPASL